MDIIKKGFGDRLKTLRKIKNYTQEALAEEIGINLRQLARIESGESFISSTTLYKICKVLDIAPKTLFDFSVEDLLLRTGTSNEVYFNVIKQDNVLRLVFDKKQPANLEGQDEEVLSFDSQMLALAQRLQKDVFVNEIEDGVVVLTKIFTPSGNIKTTVKNTAADDFENLKNKLKQIVNDKKKLSYMNLAFESLHNKEALNELKILIKGIELMQE